MRARLLCLYSEQRVHALAHHLFVERDVLRHAMVDGRAEVAVAVEEDEDGYARARGELRERLASGVAQDGDRQPTVFDVVAEYAVRRPLRVLDAHPEEFDGLARVLLLQLLDGDKLPGARRAPRRAERGDDHVASHLGGVVELPVQSLQPEARLLR